MKIIFLDVDGVLNSVNSYISAYQNKFMKIDYEVLDPVCLKYLQKIVNKTKAKIVLTSTWRLDTRHIKTLLEIFNIYNIQLLSFTDVSESRIRGREIQDWLNKNSFKFKIDKYIILDDDNDMEHLSRYLIKTSNVTGLTKNIVKEAINILNGE